MFYFRKFPYLSDKNNNRLLTHIFRRFDFLPSILENDSLFFTYETTEGESIENVALKVYGHESYSWIVLLSNRNINPAYVNYKSDWEISRFIRSKYGPHLYDVAEYITPDFLPVDDVDRYYFEHNKYLLKYKNLIPITYEQKEKTKNLNRRFLNLLKPENLNNLLNNIEEILKA